MDDGSFYQHLLARLESWQARGRKQVWLSPENRAFLASLTPGTAAPSRVAAAPRPASPVAPAAVSRAVAPPAAGPPPVWRRPTTPAAPAPAGPTAVPPSTMPASQPPVWQRPATTTGAAPVALPAAMPATPAPLPSLARAASPPPPAAAVPPVSTPTPAATPASPPPAAPASPAPSQGPSFTRIEPVPVTPLKAPPELAFDPILPDPAIAQANWEQLEALVRECTRCELCRLGRTRTVFGVGHRRARLMFIGEGPGADEDAQGEPFVGKAGQLLTKMIEAMSFTRGEVYIANIVKCRPPDNRQPEPAEGQHCLPYLQRQIALIQPDFIVVLGNTPLMHLLGLKGITSKRGQWFDYQGIPVMPTFHPSYLLRMPSEKGKAWEDMKQVMRAMGYEPRQGSRTT